MFAGTNDSKEVIRNRMLRHALNYWNLKNPDELDQIVLLMLEALSTELYNLGNDIKDTEVRLLEKIANLLAPGFLTAPNPAHGIMHALPVETEELLSENVQFYAQKDISSKQDENKDKTVDISFTAVDKVKLINAQVSVHVAGNYLFEYDSMLNKDLTAQTTNNSGIGNNMLWLGLKIDEKINNINHLYFHFDWKNLDRESADFNYQLLPLSKWYINDTEINMSAGLPYGNKPAVNQGRDLAVEHELLAQVQKDIKDHYNRKYMAVLDTNPGNVNELKQFYPDALKDFFSDSDLKKLNKKLLWVKVVFPPALQRGYLDDLYVYINTFPVMNRELRDPKPNLNGGNIIPLKTSGLEQFLAVKSLSDLTHQYRYTAFRKPEEEETGTYTLRNGGVERFDGRNAQEYIGYMLELLRSESSAFSAYGKDFISSTLIEMGQQMATMEQKIKHLANTTGETPHYIVAKPYEGNTQMYVEYWVTLAEIGNGLRSGTLLTESRSVKTKSDSLFFITPTTGGKKRLKPEDRVSAFRYGLMTRNRIVTKEDIRNLCFYELGSRISQVAVERGIEMSAHPKQGFYRTIDITLTAVQTEKVNNEAWHILLSQLQSKLQSRSGMSNHYRIFLNNH